MLWLVMALNSNAADFTLREHLGHTWKRESVTFPLTPDQAAKTARRLALVDQDNQEVAYQVIGDAEGGKQRICFQADQPSLESREYQFADRPGTAASDLKVTESAGELRVENALAGVAIRKTLQPGQAPIAAIRLRSGKWTGNSSLASKTAVKQYTAEVAARGPVFIEVTCQTTFEDGGHWNLRFRLERGEPVVLVEEAFDAPGGGTFRVSLGNKTYRPTHVLYRAGMGGNMGRVNSEPLGTGRAYLLEPWLHWWGVERQGNWFALYTAAPPPKLSIDAPNNRPKENLVEDLIGAKPAKAVADPHPDLLMVGLLRPSVWKDPQWSGQAPHVGVNVPAQIEDGQVSVAFPLGGGSRAWMLGTPDKNQSISALAEKNRRVAPLPQHYLIKHGDFPLNEVKDYVLSWEGDHENYPRLFVGKDDLQTLRGSLKSNPRELRRWEGEQPIDKYNIEDPLREYFASGSERLATNIVAKSTEWLHTVVHDDLLDQNSRVTLGVAPHSQAVLLLPALNLADAALGIPSLTPELRKQFLAQLALIGYVVNRDDYWSPARGFSANPNMTTTVAQYQVTVAALIPSHPMAKQWAAQGLQTLHGQLNQWSDEDGGWLEAPHYAMVSFDHMLGAFIMAARAGFANYLYEDRVRKVAQWFAKISTPRDIHTGGYRHHPPIGNTYHGESTGMFGILAGLWKERDPQFAAEMQWMCLEHGSPDLGLGWSFPCMTGYKDLLKAHGVAPQKPDYGSAWFRKTGVVLRNTIGSDRETYLHMIAGSNHEHYDFDSGSIVLWGKGRVLADDWGYIGRHAQTYHSVLSSSATGGNMRIADFSTQPAFDYVSGHKGAWQRQIAFVKDANPLGNNFFVIRDTHDADMPSTWKLWLTARVEDKQDAPQFPKVGGDRTSPLNDIGAELAAEAKAKQAKNAPLPPVHIHDQGVTVSGADDLDFDLFIYQPKTLSLKTETAFQDMSVGNRDGKVGPMRITQTALVATLPNRGSITVLVYPRLKTEPAPKVVWHAQGGIAELVSAAGSDYVYLASKSQSERPAVFETADKSLQFQGSAGASQVRDQRITLTLGSGGTIRSGNSTLTGTAASTKSVPR